MQLLTCPQCNQTAEAYNNQIEGLASIVCGNCGMHFYSNRTPLNIKTLPVVDIERFLVNHPRYSPTIRKYQY